MSLALEDMKNKIQLSNSNDRRIGDLLIFITDGFPTPAYNPTSMANDLKNIYNVTIIGISVTNNVNWTKM